MRSAFFVALVAVCAMVVPARPAGALPILDPGDAAELANTLADATEEQDICYGWVVTVNDENVFSGPTFDRGSSLGPDTDPFAAECTPSVVFVADLVYTSELSEAADSADFRVQSTLSIDFDADDLRKFGVSGAALLGDADDRALMAAVSALPALVAEAGLAPPVPVEETTGTIPAADGPTGGGGSDRLRNYGALYFLAGLVLLSGLGYLVYAIVLAASARSRPVHAVRFTDLPSHDDP